MNELSESVRQLPDNLEDLSRFVLIGREKLTAVRAEIKAIEKVGLAKEVHEQKLVEAQEIAEAVLDAEVKIGELTGDMETAKGQRTDIKPMDSGVLKSKASQLEEIGISEKQKQRYETLAKHPEQVKQAKEEAREEGKIVTRQDVLNRIKEPPLTSMHSISYNIQQEKREAIRRHDAFEEKKNGSGVLSMEEIQQDKEDKQISIEETVKELKNVISNFNTIITVLSEDKITEAFKEMKERDLLTIENSLYGVTRTATKLLRLTTEVKN